MLPETSPSRGDRLRDGRNYPYARIENAAFAYMPLVGPTAWTLYTYLIYRAGSRDVAWPSYSTIMQECGFGSRSTVKEAIDTLIKHGLIAVERHRKHQVYTILPVQTPADGSTAPAEEAVQKEDQPVQILDQSRNRTSPESVPESVQKVYRTGTETVLKQNTRTKRREQNTSTARPRKTDPVFDALVEAFGIDLGQITKPARGELNAAAKAIRDVGGTPEQIHRAVRRYRAEWPDIACTPSAIVKHWHRFAYEPRPSRGSTDDDYWTGYVINPKGAAA